MLSTTYTVGHLIGSWIMLSTSLCSFSKSHFLNVDLIQRKKNNIVPNKSPKSFIDHGRYNSFFFCSKQDCKQVPKEVCQKVPKKACKIVSSTVSKEIFQKECHDVTEEKCVDVNVEKCVDVTDKVCKVIDREATKIEQENKCNTITVSECKDETDNVCKTLPKEVVESKPMEQCRDECLPSKIKIIILEDLKNKNEISRLIQQTVASATVK
jgi:hypothetical protein